jgi:CDP-glucose 4,6-dehydratase
MGNSTSKMENLVNGTLFGNIYKNRKVLLTGHTGFKGSWLALWLKRLGANVVGYSLNPNTQPSHFELMNIDMTSHFSDINNIEKMQEVFSDFQPEIVFHLAAQPIVLESYKTPVQTFQTNAIGTANVLECCRNTASVKAIVVITTDKVYENNEWTWGYREIDRLGGYDPYSASKACTEIVCSSFRNSFFNLKDYKYKHQILLATARAGNVIGGGDWAEYRLIPDLMKAYAKGEKLIIRNPNAIRPWQHVLEPLAGYLMLGQQLLEEKTEFADAWNFGPSEENCVPVSRLIEIVQKTCDGVEVELVKNNLHEANFLKLDCSKALHFLKWKPIWEIETTLRKTVDWYKEFYQSGTISSEKDINNYILDAQHKNINWATL